MDPLTGEFVWQTDGADGGRIALTLSANAPGSGRLPETQGLVFWIADDPGAPGARDPEPLHYTEEWGLPVIHIEVDGPMTESEQPAVITVRDQQVDGAAKIRGASSTGYPKVSYTLDFQSDELSVEEWGDKSREHMVLTTTFDDNSYVRQKLSFDLWRAMAVAQDVQRLTPRTFFGVVYINGDYIGLYMGCDRIDDEFLRHMGFAGEGNMYKAISHDANFKLTGANGYAKTWLSSGYEKTEGPEPDDFADLDALVAWTGSTNPTTLWTEGSSRIDLDEFIDWFLFVSVALAQDSAGKNAYLYHDEDGGQLRFVPWDFNDSWGQNWYTARIEADVINDYTWNNRVFELLQAHPDAAAEIRARYQRLRDGGPFDPASLQALLDGYYATITPSAERDWETWGSTYQRYDRWAGTRNAYGDWQDFEGERAYLETWIADRMAVMDAWAR